MIDTSERNILPGTDIELCLAKTDLTGHPDFSYFIIIGIHSLNCNTYSFTSNMFVKLKDEPALQYVKNFVLYVAEELEVSDDFCEYLALKVEKLLGLQPVGFKNIDIVLNTKYLKTFKL